jgi:hypothetical protein
MFPRLIPLMSSIAPALSGRRTALLAAKAATARTSRTIPTVVGLWD